MESGWGKSSLIQRNKDKGSSISKLDPELSTLIDNVIKSHRKKPNIKYQKIYDEVAEKLKEINIEKVKHGKDELACCSYQTIMKKVKKRR